jgi:hypothetical protein
LSYKKELGIYSFSLYYGDVLLITDARGNDYTSKPAWTYISSSKTVRQQVSLANFTIDGPKEEFFA